jgi:hypothetical protein
VSELPDELLEAALFPELDLPDPPDGHPYTRRHGEGYVIGYMAGMSHATVAVRRLPAEQIDERLEEVRSLLTEAGYRHAAWVIVDAVEPLGLAALLEQHGLGLWPENADGLERHFRQMVLAEKPPPAVGVEGRQIETFEEFAAAAALGSDAFEMSEQNRRALEEQLAALWDSQERFPDFKSFGAFIDGEVIGSAHAVFGRRAVYLVGGSVRSDRRGRGAYRALVRARWDAAVACGTPALTVTAGSMSGPVLARLGFAVVAEGVVLSDRF